MTRTKGNYNYYIFILIFYLIIFRELLENYLPIFGYLDELISCMAIPIAIKKLYERHGLLRIRKNMLPILGWCCNSVCISRKYSIWISGYAESCFTRFVIDLKFWLSI